MQNEGLLDRIKGVFSNNEEEIIDMDQLSNKLDEMIASGQLPSGDEAIEELNTQLKSLSLSKKPKSRMKVRKTTDDIGYSYNISHWLYQGLRELANKRLKVPAYGDPGRDLSLAKVWRNEPILAGAVYSMAAKMTALSWQIVGDREKALEYARILARAAHIDGYDWGGFISSSAEEFYTTDRGVFWEVARAGRDKSFGPMVALGHIDSLACELTGNTRRPVRYESDITDQRINFRPGEFIHFTSLPSPREEHLGIGFCAVSRALKAAALLTGLHEYDAEKLSNLPPEGVAAITGLTQTEFMDAIKIWKAARVQDDSLTFPQVLWLIGSQPNVQVKIDFVGFSQVPESFDRETVITQYVNTLALDFGVDVREFWPVSSSALGTASESEIQHLKAKGKGPGEFISIIERHINGELPADVDFGFDTQDIEEDMMGAAIAKAWVDAYMPLLVSPQQKQPAAAPPASLAKQVEEVDGWIISKDEFLRLLVDKRVLPDYLISDDRSIVMDTDVHIKEYGAEYSRFEYKNGLLIETRLPTTILNSAPKQIPAEVPVALQAKQLPAVKNIDRNIRGGAIADKEVERGTGITRKTIRSELDRWRGNANLSPHAVNVEEEDAYVERTLS